MVRRSVLEHIWDNYLDILHLTLTDTQKINRVQNKFRSFTGFTLKILYSLYDNELVMQILGLNFLEDRRKNFEIFLNRLGIRLLLITLRDVFYLSLGQTNFARNAP